MRGALATCVALGSLPALAADDKAKAGPSGAWARKDGMQGLEFADKDVLKLFPHGKDAGIVIVCSYSVDKEGLIKAKITELQAKDEVKAKLKELVPVGYEFNFHWKAKDDKATLGDIKGENAEHLKAHLEGDYEKKN
jgi:hypothetical protein